LLPDQIIKIYNIESSFFPISCFYSFHLFSLTFHYFLPAMPVSHKAAMAILSELPDGIKTGEERKD